MNTNHVLKDSMFDVQKEKAPKADLDLKNKDFEICILKDSQIHGH